MLFGHGSHQLNFLDQKLVLEDSLLSSSPPHTLKTGRVIERVGKVDVLAGRTPRSRSTKNLHIAKVKGEGAGKKSIRM